MASIYCSLKYHCGIHLLQPHASSHPSISASKQCCSAHLLQHRASLPHPSTSASRHHCSIHLLQSQGIILYFSVKATLQHPSTSVSRQHCCVLLLQPQGIIATSINFSLKVSSRFITPSFQPQSNTTASIYFSIGQQGASLRRPSLQPRGNVAASIYGSFKAPLQRTSGAAPSTLASICCTSKALLQLTISTWFVTAGAFLCSGPGSVARGLTKIPFSPCPFLFVNGHGDF